MTTDNLLTLEEQAERDAFFEALDKKDLLTQLEKERDTGEARINYLVNYYSQAQAVPQARTLRKVDTVVETISYRTIDYRIAQTENYSGRIRRDADGKVESYGRYEFTTWSALIFGIRIEAPTRGELMDAIRGIKG
jgi:hypothetical protein